ncbi:hypothetical protein C1H46_037927 [Malus baccata]|uniref:Uncharacterized protein n=1 Tax=Malus baccata TaxID=106549 RepID=A0A540KR92_MALBA|nr:hypothetical protein C1H46_037927 [Malus baccata]
MASAPWEEKQKQAYEGLGVGGKTWKMPFRRTTQATPYDRPPTIFTKPSGAANDDWLSKLVDPAQRLISTSAHCQHLLPPQSPSTTTYRMGTIDQCSDPNHPSSTDDGGKLTNLKQILKQKIFTRSEIDRLTALLHSRTIDMPVENLEKRFEGIPSKSVVCHNRREEFPKTPLLDKKGIDNCLASNPVVSTRTS